MSEQATLETRRGLNMIRAAHDGKLESLKQLRLEGGSVRVENLAGMTPLHFAAQEGHADCVRFLIEQGAGVGDQTRGIFGKQQPPLHLAASEGHADCVRELLAASADPNVLDEAGDSPLNEAIMGGHTDCVRVLVARGADVWRANMHGHTPLLLAVKQTVQIVRILLEAGADETPNSPVYRDQLPPRETRSPKARAVEVASRHGMHEITQFIMQFTHRTRHMCRWRRAIEAKRDAGMVFKAASEGRPMELARRLRLGKLAGGLEMEGEVEDGAGGTRAAGPLEAARLGGHDECFALLQESMVAMEEDTSSGDDSSDDEEKEA